ncbi:hypothetical protein H632_c4301p0, partial [Helicosporidium sp. ATCC 50920]
MRKTTLAQRSASITCRGELSDCRVLEGKGYAFVTFAVVSAAQAFLESRDHRINGQGVEAKAAVKQDQNSGRLTKKLFVHGLGELADSDFYDHFSQYGNIVESNILRKPNGMSKGYGFVTFDDEMSVEKCLVTLHTIQGRSVEAKRANDRTGLDSGAGELAGAERGA